MVATAGIVASLWFAQANSTQYEMIAYGQRQTDREAVMREVSRTLDNAQGSTPNVGAELKDAFAQYQ